MSNYYIQQSIQIQFIKIGGMSNSSILQIGTCGQITTNDFLYNTGGFTEPAPEAQKNGASPSSITPLVPLQSPG
ncbi:spore gernimation protein [Bacillus sp. NTK074B]|uniref:spore germination protein GerPB n=1 Tax=Bacillus sp. NTK074B TaxID=2802174 RepID=UPI001A902F09|nr:spore gernimation protein [Bacillus sp. NTK074B]